MARYVPDAGDIVWLNFRPQAGHEQAGHRPALVLSPAAYNNKTSLMICCPVTTQIKNYPFEVLVAGPQARALLVNDPNIPFRGVGQKPILDLCLKMIISALWEYRKCEQDTSLE